MGVTYLPISNFLKEGVGVDKGGPQILVDN